VNVKEEITPRRRTKERRRTSWSSANTADFAENIPLIKRQNRILYKVPAGIFIIKRAGQ
jgi:hypothetical protein